MKDLAIAILTFVLVWWVWSWPLSAYGQQHYIDSIEQRLQEMAPDSHRVNALNDLAYYLAGMDAAAAQVRAEEALALAQQLGFVRGTSKAWYMLGYALMQQGRYEEALEAAIRCRDLSAQAGLGYRLPAVWTLIGSIYRQMGRQQEALDAFLSAVELTKEWGDSLDLAYAWINLATTYIDLDQAAQAREILQRAAAIFEAYGMDRSLVETWINLGATDLPAEKKMTVLRRAIRKATELDYPSALSYAWHNLGACLLDSMGQVRPALEAYLKAIDFSRRSQDQYEEATATIDAGHAYAALGMLDSAQWHLERGLELARRLGSRQMEADALEELAALFARKGDYARAYALQEARIRLQDTLFNEQLTEKLAEANARYESEKKEARIAAQQLEIERQRNTRNLVIGLALIALLLTATILQRRYYLQRRMKERAEAEARRKAEQAALLRQLDEQKTAFFSYLAHELRTPLTLMLGPLEEALSLLRQANLERPLRTAMEQANQLLVLVNQILDMVRYDAGMLERQDKTVELDSFFAGLYDSFAAAARKKNIALEWQVAPELKAVFRVDTAKLRHICYNLLSNALKFTPPGGKVRLVARYEDHALHLSVSDTGPGIAPEARERIFERYYQTREGRARGGTGLGLAWTAELTAFLGGRIEVESEPGKGAVFHVRLPLERAGASGKMAGPERTAAEEEPAGHWQPDFVPRVLLVEDNPDMAEYVRRLLDPPMEVHHVFDGDAALQWLERHDPPDLIISDVMMPGMDGFTLRRRLADHHRWRQVPFIFLTASGAERDVLKGFALGVDDYLVKPFHPAELVARVRNAIERGRRRQTFTAAPQQDGDNGRQTLSADETLLRKAEAIVLENLDNPDFGVAQLAEALNYSKRQLSRIINRLTGMTPVEFILEIRLQKAMELLRKGQYATVAEVRYEVGIESASYFTKKFRQRFGIRPSEVRQTS